MLLMCKSTLGMDCMTWALSIVLQLQLLLSPIAPTSLEHKALPGA